MNAKAAASSDSRSRLGTWADHHVYSLVASLGRMLRKPWATALTVGVMAVALALPLGLWAALANIERFTGDVEQSRQIAVFLKPGLAAERASALAEELRARRDIAAIELRTPEQGLAELREKSGLGEAIATLDGNPLPSLLLITPKGDELLLAESLKTLPDADLVQHDAGWRQRLDGWLRFGTRLAWVLAALLGLGALLVVGNTVRLDIQSRREEIGVLQLLGATDGFIRRPFLYLGACYGLASGAQLWQRVRAARIRPALRGGDPGRRGGAGLAGRGAGDRALPAPDPSHRHLTARSPIGASRRDGTRDSDSVAVRA